MIRNLVFSGGGLKCICYIGILKYLEEYNILKNIKAISSTSGGSIFALCIILGYSYNDLLELIIKLDFEKVRDISSDSLIDFFTNLGIDSGNKLIYLIKLFIIKKYGKNSENITFIELYKKTKINYTITGTCLNTKSIEYFNYQNTPNMSIIQALRISFSIPLIYSKVNYNNKLYVDGGIVNNFPINIFLNNLEETLGFYICGGNDNNNENLDNITIDKYILSIVRTLTNNIEINNISKYSNNIVVIRTNNSFINFTLNEDEKNEIINIGYNSIKEYFEKKKLKIIHEININKINIIDNASNNLILNNKINIISNINKIKIIDDTLNNLSLNNKISIINNIDINYDLLK